MQSVRAFLAGVAFLLPAVALACPALLNFTVPKLQDNSPQSLCQYEGKVLLVVNTASYCGFTSQYEGLEALYRKYKDQGLVVIGFPSNDFGQQEPGSAREIADFCRSTYGVQFPMMAKTDVVEPGTSPFYRQLIAKSGSKPRWNFHKYLIDRRGEQIQAFSSFTKPDSAELVGAIEKRLAEK
ncbi:MAG: glutathione peroxidase [Proteobacteria bacterium]|nr:glutathione peroxidase [Pseudomonadota bacterium]HQR04387.1 glutathione peroxidase [Rhodocyclaceae bacterium]